MTHNEVTYALLACQLNEQTMKYIMTAYSKVFVSSSKHIHHARIQKVLSEGVQL